MRIVNLTFNTILILDSAGIMPSFQSAYQKDHSTESALVKVFNDILLAIDKGEISALFTLDLSAAFDCVDHELLLDRLRKRFGIKNTALDWFKSYLMS